MGVQNLLPLLSAVSKRVSLTEFQGKRMAIDGFVWLHRASFRCAKDLVNNPGTDKFLPYVMNLIQKIISYGITPVVVFDGQQLPQKKHTNQKRHIERAEARSKAIELESMGMSDQAYSFYQKAVEITSATVFTWVQKLRENNIEYIVAPYEADAELAYLCRTSYVDCVLTEDSDLLAYQTPVTLFKFDAASMTVVMICYDDVLSHLGLTTDQFIGFCCYTGCDYIDHISKLGIQTALKLMRKYEDPFEILATLKEGDKYEIPENFEEQLKKAIITYHCQRVFDPRTKTLQTLSPIDSPQDFIGPDMSSEMLLQIVTCEIDTRTYAKLRPDPPTGPVSPYFKKRSTPNKAALQSNIGSGAGQSQNLALAMRLSKKIQEKENVREEKKSSSRFFEAYKSIEADEKQSGIHRSGVRSYLHLHNVET
ncbi:XPG I-region family protein [Tritrichomonas foetus]|uniref:XPG I-region family protein n=1 Tax=Tritrichomonas foetus TaxID=1144522 RepID=A0A1J4KA23_9EUKA|nr:XPG I-region family protein [Tritrichomonas foetus]|eukprot:OHT08279.1 XPG I-region family protein [Tritrichomonas foetus]